MRISGQLPSRFAREPLESWYNSLSRRRMKKKGYSQFAPLLTVAYIEHSKLVEAKPLKSVAELRPAPCVARKLYALMAKGLFLTNYVYEFGVLFGCVGVRVGNSNSSVKNHLKLREIPGQDTRSPEDLGGWTGKATSHNRGQGLGMGEDEDGEDTCWLPGAFLCDVVEGNFGIPDPSSRPRLVDD